MNSNNNVSTTAALARATVTAGRTEADEFTFVEPNAWRLATPRTFPALRLIPNLATPRLIIKDTATATNTIIPAGLGLISAYSRPTASHALVVKLYVSPGDMELYSTAATQIGLTATVSHALEPAETKWFSLDTLEKADGYYVVSWSPTDTSTGGASSEGHHVSLKLFVQTQSPADTATPSLDSSIVPPAASCKSVGQFDLFVAYSPAAAAAPPSPSHIPSFTDDDNGTVDLSMIKSADTAPPAKSTTPDSVRDSRHIFYDMVKHRNSRPPPSDISVDVGKGTSTSTSTSNAASHPLFNRWISEDSPAFRSVIHSMEEQAFANRAKYKELARHSASLREAYQQFIKQFRDATSALEALPMFQPLVGCLIEPLRHSLNQILNTVCTNWDMVVISNAKRVYESTFKGLESKRTGFSVSSDHYYDELSKYLKAKTSDDDRRRDAQFAKHRATFDEVRWSYFLDLWLASGGWSELEFFMAVLKWYKSVMTAYVASDLLTAEDNSATWFLDNIAAVREEIKQQKIEASQFQTAIVNKRFSQEPSPVPSDHTAATASDENPEASGFVRVSIDASSSTASSSAPKDRRRVNMLRLSAVQAPDHPNQLISALPPVPPIDLDLLSDTLSVSSSKSAAKPKSVATAVNEVPAQAMMSRKPLQLNSPNDGSREGFLFARISNKNVTTTKGMMATSNSVWRRYWCVVKDGKFQKFAHWKSQGIPEPKGDPIELNTATVRELGPEAKQANKRRFCFEIITPNYYGVFQATSDQDLQTWVDVLRRAIELSLLSISARSVRSMAPASADKSGDSMETKSKHSGWHALAQISRSTQASKSESALSSAISDGDTGAKTNIGGAPATAKRDDGAVRKDSASSFVADSPLSPGALLATPISEFANIDPRRRLSLTTLLPMLQQDEANDYCADCTTQMPEWCSLNLGCVLCIECSGIHRSLGTHISKVRSLTLDVISFTPITISMLLSTGNALNKAIYDPSASQQQKPAPDSPRDVKQQFINAKYVLRSFVDRSWQPEGALKEALDRWAVSGEQPNADAANGDPKATQSIWNASSATALLFAATEIGDLAAAMRSLALGADVNLARTIPSTAAIATPLLAALFGQTRLLEVQGLASGADSSGQAAEGFQTRLEIAELLILNGANVNLPDNSKRTPLHIACILNSLSAVKYLVSKGADPLLCTESGHTPLDFLSEQQYAARSIIATATQKAEDKISLDQPSPKPSTNGSQRSLENNPRHSLRRGSSFTLSRGNGNTGIRLSSIGDKILESSTKHDYAVFSTARKFTQSLVSPNGGLSRVSVSTERPTLLEINGGSRASRDAHLNGVSGGPQGSGHNGGNNGWLQSITASKAGRRSRRLTNGLRELGHKLAGSPKTQPAKSKAPVAEPESEAEAAAGSKDRVKEQEKHADVPAISIPGNSSLKTLHTIAHTVVPIAEESGEVADDDIAAAVTAAADAIAESDGHKGALDSASTPLSSISIPPVPPVIPPPPLFDGQRSGLIRSATVSGSRSPHSSKSPSMSGRSLASLSRSNSMRSAHLTRSNSKNTKLARKMPSYNDMSVPQLPAMLENPEYASSAAESFVEVQEGGIDAAAASGERAQDQADAKSSGKGKSQTSLVERPTSEGKLMKTQVLKRRVKHVMDTQNAASFSYDDLPGHSSVSPLPVPASTSSTHGKDSQHSLSSSAGSNKRLFRLIPKSSRITFNGMFGRNGNDKKNVVNADGR